MAREATKSTTEGLGGARFLQTLRLLGDRDRSSFITFAFAAAGLVGWSAWFLGAELPVYEVTDTARVEAYQEAHSVDAPIAGRVVSNELVLGRHFEPGEIVVELDADLERAMLTEERARLTAIDPEISALSREIEAREQALGHEQQMLRFAVDEAKSKRHEAELSEGLAKSEEHRAKALFDKGTIAEIEMLRTETGAELRSAQREGATRGASRIEVDRRMRGSLGRSQIEELRRDWVSLQGKRGVVLAAIHVLESRIDRHILRAQVAGIVADAAAARPGSFVHEGQKLGAIVPPGTLKIVAQFAPGALGRLKPGQLARVRLEGFPWIQFGAVDATVARVASEVRDGVVRVELDPVAHSAASIPLEHGLPGSAEVIVERASPAWLVFRNVGRYTGRVLPGRPVDVP